jgi:hypothetical protein
MIDDPTLTGELDRQLSRSQPRLYEPFPPKAKSLIALRHVSSSIVSLKHKSIAGSSVTRKYMVRSKPCGSGTCVKCVLNEMAPFRVHS